MIKRKKRPTRVEINWRRLLGDAIFDRGIHLALICLAAGIIMLVGSIVKPNFSYLWIGTLMMLVVVGLLAYIYVESSDAITLDMTGDHLRADLDEVEQAPMRISDVG